MAEFFSKIYISFSQDYHYKKTPITSAKVTHPGFCQSGPLERDGEVFGPGRFYLEVQNHFLPEEDSVNRSLVRLARETGIPPTATNNVCFLDPTDQPFHALAYAVSHSKNRRRPTNRDTAINRPKKCKKLFHHLPMALENTVTIAEVCKAGNGQTGTPPRSNTLNRGFLI